METHLSSLSALAPQCVKPLADLGNLLHKPIKVGLVKDEQFSIGEYSDRAV
jgi:hypothetical protein